MNQSTDINEIAKALCEAQKESLFALKDSSNPFFKSKYADLSSVWEAARGPLTKNGLSVVQTMDATEGSRIIINTILMHISGQWIGSKLAVKPVKDDPQGIGSAITYGRRYGLQAIVGICPDDDDGEKSMGRKNNTPTPIPLTKDQIEDIEVRIKQVGADEKAFLKFFGVKKISEMKTDRYTQAIQMLESKRQKASA